MNPAMNEPGATAASSAPAAKMASADAGVDASLPKAGAPPNAASRLAWLWPVLLGVGFLSAFGAAMGAYRTAQSDPKLVLWSTGLQLLLGVAAAWNCAFVVWQARHPESASLSVSVGVAARGGRAVQWGWALLGLAALKFCAAQALMLNGTARGENTVWWAHECLLVSGALFWMGLLSLARWRGTPNALRLMLDVVMTVLAVLVVLWTTVLQPFLLDSSLSWGDKALSAAFPLNDLAMLFGLLMLTLASVRGNDDAATQSAARFLVPGTFLLMISDALFFANTLLSNGQPGPCPHIFRAGGWALLGFAAICARSLRNTHPMSVARANRGSLSATRLGMTCKTMRESRFWSAFNAPNSALLVWMPYVSALGACALTVTRTLREGHSELVWQLAPVLLLMLAIVARQMITLLENLRLSNRLREVNRDLELNVAERTLHLSTLHGIGTTLNSSLSRRAVLRATLEETVAAVHADGGGIWLHAQDGAPAGLDEAPDWTLVERGTPIPGWKLAHWRAVSSLQNVDSNNGDSNDHASNNGHVALQAALQNTFDSDETGDRPDKADDSDLSADPDAQILLRDLTIAAVTGQLGRGETMLLSPPTRNALQSGQAPPPHRLIIVPLAWRDTLLGAMGLIRQEGAFSYDERALVESVALEASVALQNARLYWEASQRADRDGVTGLLNHRAMQEHLNACVSRAKRSERPFSVVMMDLNNFKFFNDTYGHPAGDRVLQSVAQGLREACRRGDYLGRFGGDEFIAILTDTDSRGAFEMCTRVTQSLDQRHFQAESGLSIPIGASFGWATYPHDAEDPSELLARADASLYRNKRGGGLPLATHDQNPLEEREAWKKLRSRSWGGSFSTLDALITAIDNKDRYTRHHSEEVTRLALLLARELGWDEEELQAVRISGLLHDVGKIAVPDDILRHPGRLGRDETQIMQQHPVFGALIVKDLPHLSQVLEGVRSHHERFDGGGYPDNLQGEDIPAMGRLLAVADCYSAMTTDRPYRKCLTHDDALQEIERCAGTQFDPEMARAFISMMRRGQSSAARDVLEEAAV